MTDIALEYADLLHAPYKDGGLDPKTGINCWGVTCEVRRRLGLRTPSIEPPQVGDDSWELVGVTANAATRLGDVILSWHKQKPHVSVLAAIEPTRVAMTTAERAGVVAIPLSRLQNISGVYRPKP